MDYILTKESFEDTRIAPLRLPMSDPEENVLLLMKMVDNFSDSQKHMMIALMMNALKVEWFDFREYYERVWNKE
jgi:hypothetical protein